MRLRFISFLKSLLTQTALFIGSYFDPKKNVGKIKSHFVKYVQIYMKNSFSLNPRSLGEAIKIMLMV